MDQEDFVESIETEERLARVLEKGDTVHFHIMNAKNRQESPVVQRAVVTEISKPEHPGGPRGFWTLNFHKHERITEDCPLGDLPKSQDGVLFYYEDSEGRFFYHTPTSGPHKIEGQSQRAVGAQGPVIQGRVINTPTEVFRRRRSLPNAA